MIPGKDKNIYPLTRENVRAVLNFYFQFPDGDIEWLFEQRELSINQIEFIARQVSDNITYFTLHMPNGLTISNIMNYGIDALSNPEINWRGSKSRLNIAKGFKEIVKNKPDMSFRNN